MGTPVGYAKKDMCVCHACISSRVRVFEGGAEIGAFVVWIQLTNVSCGLVFLAILATIDSIVLIYLSPAAC